MTAPRLVPAGALQHEHDGRRVGLMAAKGRRPTKAQLAKAAKPKPKAKGKAIKAAQPAKPSKPLAERLVPRFAVGRGKAPMPGAAEPQARQLRATRELPRRGPFRLLRRRPKPTKDEREAAAALADEVEPEVEGVGEPLPVAPAKPSRFAFLRREKPAATKAEEADAVAEPVEAEPVRPRKAPKPPKPRVDHGVLLRWRPKVQDAAARHAPQLAAALAAEGVALKESHPRAVARAFPRWSRRIVHALRVEDNPRLVAADVVSVRNAAPLLRPDLTDLGRGGLRRWRRRLRRALRRGWVVTSSEQARKEILEEFRAEADPARVLSIPDGLDHATFHPGEAGRWVRNVRRTGLLNVVAVMDGEPGHRLDLVVEACAASPHVNLMHVGSPAKGEAAGLGAKQDAALRHMAKQGRYQALGRLPDGLLRDLYAAADVVVHSAEAEGVGVSPLAPLAVGAAVIAPDTPAHREVLGEAVRYFPLDARALADELDLAWTGVTPTLEHFPAADVRLRQAELFTWKRTAERHKALYGHIEKAGPFRRHRKAPPS